MAFLRLSVVLPLVLATTFVADGVTRALPRGTWSFRAWEGLVVDNKPLGPFQPLAQFDSPRSSGDLANMGNLRVMRIYRRETFTTDAFGFRNPPDRAGSGAVAVLLLGDSFSVGSGVADDLTLSGQLTTHGHVTYTMAPVHPRPASLAAFATMLKMKPGDWVVHQQTYTYNESDARDVALTPMPPVTAAARFTQSFREDFRPLRILVNQAWRFVQNDRWFPNPFKGAVQQLRLQNGDAMLFLLGEIAPEFVSPDTAQSIADSVRYARSLSDEAHRLGLRYLAVLVPVKFAVYQHLLDPPVTAAARAPGTITEAERQLTAAGMRVLNLFEPLASRATQAASRHEYVYWRDDTHWNPVGIGIAAQAIAAVIDEEKGRAR